MANREHRGDEQANNTSSCRVNTPYLPATLLVEWSVRCSQGPYGSAASGVRRCPTRPDAAHQVPPAWDRAGREPTRARRPTIEAASSVWVVPAAGVLLDIFSAAVALVLAGLVVPGGEPLRAPSPPSGSPSASPSSGC